MATLRRVWVANRVKGRRPGSVHVRSNKGEEALRRKLLIIAAALATALATALPVSGAEKDSPEFGSHKTVEKSEYDSYVVVMKAEPLVVTEGQDNLDTRKAKNRGNALKKEQDQALEDAGASSDDKVHEYVNAVNGFSALVSHDEALALATIPRSPWFNRTNCISSPPTRARTSSV